MGMTKHGQKPTEDLSGWGLLTAALPKGGEPEAAPPQPRTISSLQQSHAHQQSVSSESYWFYFVPYPETKNLQAPFGNLLREICSNFSRCGWGPFPLSVISGKGGQFISPLVLSLHSFRDSWDKAISLRLSLSCHLNVNPFLHTELKLTASLTHILTQCDASVFLSLGQALFLIS